jgi:hypothetical protein
MPYALFLDGKQISKAHKHRLVVKIEAYERGCYLECRAGLMLHAGYEIREVEEDRNNG